MSDPSAEQGLTQDQINFKKHVNHFVQQQRQKQYKLEEEGKRPNKTINELIVESSSLDEQAVDVFFEKEHQYLVSPETVEAVRKAFAEMLETLNAMNPKKRFFILETMDFFRSSISIGKLVPALLILEGDDQKAAISEFIRPTFLSINKNVEILTSTNEIFEAHSIHLDRGSLYTLVSDIGKILIKLYKKGYIERLPEANSPVAMMLTVLQDSQVRINKYRKAGQKPSYDFMVDDGDTLRNVILEFVATIQSHEGLLNYSLKRHSYYKLFLSNVTRPGTFKGVDPLDVSKIFAGCLVANQQLKPPEELIDAMITPERGLTKETLKMRKEFIDQLSPTTVYKLIGQIRSSLQHFSKVEFSQEFEAVGTLSVKNILKRIWTGFVRFAETVITTATEPVKIIYGAVKSTFAAFMAEERQKQGPPLPKKVKKDSLVPKSAESLRIINENYNVVETDVLAFRGEFDGASQKDFGYNARLFKQDEVTQVRFQYAFERLFKAMHDNPKLKVVDFKTQSRIREYYVAFNFAEYMICLGTTHQKSVSATEIQEKDIFPYVLFFREAESKAFGRVLSREIKGASVKSFFNEESLTGNNAKFFYESLFHILHLLPEADWKSKDCQLCVKFLIKELQTIATNDSLVFLSKAPELPE